MTRIYTQTKRSLFRFATQESTIINIFFIRAASLVCYTFDERERSNILTLIEALIQKDPTELF